MSWIKISDLSSSEIWCTISISPPDTRSKRTQVKIRFPKMTCAVCDIVPESATVFIGAEEDDGFLRIKLGEGAQRVVNEGMGRGSRIFTSVWQGLPLYMEPTKVEQVQWDAKKREMTLALPEAMRSRPYMDDLGAKAPDNGWKRLASQPF